MYTCKVCMFMIYCSWVMKMPMKYDKLFELMKNKEKNNGVTTWSLRHYEEAGLPNGVGEATIQRLRKGEPVRMDVLCRLCYLLKCQPGDIMEYVPDEGDVKK